MMSLLQIKRIEVDPGGRLSYQYHHKRSEAWTITEGVGTITLDGETADYMAGETIDTKGVSRVRIRQAKKLFL